MADSEPRVSDELDRQDENGLGGLAMHARRVDSEILWTGRPSLALLIKPFVGMVVWVAIGVAVALVTRDGAARCLSAVRSGEAGQFISGYVNGGRPTPNHGSLAVSQSSPHGASSDSWDVSLRGTGEARKQELAALADAYDLLTDRDIGRIRLYVGFGIVVWVVLRFLWRVLVLKCTSYLVTNDRIECEEGVFSRDTENIDLFRIVDYKLTWRPARGPVCP